MLEFCYFNLLISEIWKKVSVEVSLASVEKRNFVGASNDHSGKHLDVLDFAQLLVGIVNLLKTVGIVIIMISINAINARIIRKC